jgi:ABC-type spermidine/putrescine transport system permease subunit II
VSKSQQEALVGFDLWRMLGVSPIVGMGAAAGALVVAALFAVRIARRNRAGARRVGLSLNE